MVKVGLTGNIGMGKSTVLGLFSRLGAAVLDSDAIVSELLTGADLLKRIQDLLGQDVVDGSTGELNRRMVASMIFSDAQKRRQYESLIHPLVYDRIQESMGLLESDIVVVEVPLLFETGHEKDFDRTVTVVSDQSVAMDRLKKLGLRADEAEERMRSQMPIEEKVSRSDYIVDNNGDMDNTAEQVRRIVSELEQLNDAGRND